MKNNKASGPDSVITEIIKEDDEEILDLLKDLFLQMFKGQLYPAIME